MENLLETTFKRLEKHFNETDCAFISACRNENTPEENNKRTKALSKDLQDLGYGFIKIKGHYIEEKSDGTQIPVDEKSFAIFNNNDQFQYKTDFMRDMIALCRKYDQECVLIKLKGQPGHYYSQDGTTSENFNKISLDILDNYYSQLRNTKFVFTETDESDNKEDYSRFNQTFGTRVSRTMLYKTLQDLYPDLFERN